MLYYVVLSATLAKTMVKKAVSMSAHKNHCESVDGVSLIVSQALQVTAHSCQYDIHSLLQHSFILVPMESCTYSVCCTKLAFVRFFYCSALSDNPYAKWERKAPRLPWPLRWAPSSTADCQVPRQKDRTCDSPSEYKPHTATPPHHPVERINTNLWMKTIQKLSDNWNL